MGILEVKERQQALRRSAGPRRREPEREGELRPRDHRAERGGQIHPAQLLVGKLIPDTGSSCSTGKSVLGRKPFEINQMGISRVFQTPEIFGDLTVLENMMIPMLCQARRGVPDACDRTGQREKDVIEQADAMLEESHGREARHDSTPPLSRGDKRRLEIGHVPRAGTPEAAAPGRADRRHGARRHQQHHRPAQADQR
jgi:hypothetical protein